MTSRRNPAADKAAANQQVIKSLLKLPGNKHCADCKRNAHPRWASWNLGIFVCIRCSGIHRGMGTHISRVKSVDLDTWTDEQLQSMLRWGNSRANKYWEAKLAVGHVPSESKIENFVRTKYESKRWVMEGAMPDPSTLADSDEDDTPLRVVQEKQRAEAALSPTATKAAPPVDLFNDGPSQPIRQARAPPPPQAPIAAAPPKQQAKPADSLLGLDFFSPSPSVSPRPADNSANQMGGASSSGASSRPDLNRSILSLYSSAPKSQPKTHQSTNSGSFSSYQSPPAHQSMGGLGGLDDAFGGLSFSTAGPPTSLQQPVKQASPFDSLTAGLKSSSGSSGMMGGSVNRSTSSNTNLGNFGKTSPSQSSSSAGFGDLFNLSSPTKTVAPAPAPSYTSKPATSNTMSFDNAWNSSPQPTAQNSTSTAFDWNTPTVAPKKANVASDDDFGGFSTGGFGALAAPAANTNKPNGGAKPISYDEDLFNNVWS